MPVRFRRKRVLIICVISICTIIYLIKNHSENPANNRDDISNIEIKIKNKPYVDKIVHKTTTATTTTTTQSPFRTVREEIVEIDEKKLRKIDWHDYELIDRENARKGLGEGGTGVEPSVQERNSPEFKRLYGEHGFHAFISNNISLDRSVKDIRHLDCKFKLYLAELSTVSIIIPTHDEHLPTLLRSIHSILNRTPAKLLEEIIIVDDASGKEELKAALDTQVANLTKTRIIRLHKREGLIRTRLAGAREAKGEILIFFDSHIEVNINWLPPLIEPIVLNYKTSVCPFIDIIKWENFAYIAQDDGARGAFDWGMFYKRLPLLTENVQKPTEPFDNPVMAGGLFAISKKWFWELGGYDEGLDVWGGEQYEMSFKIWQCGGRLVDAPCSRVGHIYRQFNPHGGFSFGDYLSRNHKRVAVVWMDEYAEYVYKRNGHMRTVNPGNVKKQLELRKKLECKPFKWFMENVAFDLPRYYPPVPLPPYATGEIRSMNNSLCIDTKHANEHATFGLDLCLRDHQGRSGEQDFELGWRQDIRPKGRELCFDVPQRSKRTSIVLFACHGMRGNQHFVYDINNYHILHVATRLCLDCDLESRQVFMEQCNTKNVYELGEIIGQGAYGCVFKSRNVTTNETVAIKKMTILRTGDGLPTSVIREGALLKRVGKVDNDNLIKLKEVFNEQASVDRQNIYFIFEYVERDLERYLKMHSPLDINRIRNLTQQLLTAVSVLHSHSIFHRDIKPQNILVTNNDILKLADFGLAREYHEHKVFTTVVVTMWYRAPEILLSSSYCTSADMWSVGCILGEMALGRPLFAAKSESRQLRRIILLMGLPNEDEWPQDSPIRREAFENYSQPIITLERLIRFEDSCAFELLRSLLSFKQSLRPTAIRALEHNFFRRTDHTSCTVTWSSADIAEATAAVPNLDAYTDGDFKFNNDDDQKIENIRSRTNSIDAGYYYQSWSSPDDGQHMLTIDSHISSVGGDVPQSPIDIVSWWLDSPQ
ncbi:unnamed protein product [Rotaria sordida]|uniref:Polypeptide N-acetylgalactosaminyltransferase n=1 Tax=Rotaria sordida TaxID=392033 RepID=A0A815R4V7_9BILA|nr:unnamed protein product [Rotaria sordida]CAF3934534.1 unnamed protein product [Rotaria sordida]